MSDVMDDTGVTAPRWTATIYYLADAGVVDVEHDLSEIGDLHAIVERGPHWDTIARIVIERTDARAMTIEEAKSL